jgi:hypothetical protein
MAVTFVIVCESCSVAMQKKSNFCSWCSSPFCYEIWSLILGYSQDLVFLLHVMSLVVLSWVSVMSFSAPPPSVNRFLRAPGSVQFSVSGPLISSLRGRSIEFCSCCQAKAVGENSFSCSGSTWPGMSSRAGFLL